MTQPTTFERASAVTFASPERYTAAVPDGWQQGRGAFGGLVLATLLRAVERSEATPRRRARSLTGEICAPVLPGEVAIELHVLRRGRNVSFVDARMLQSGEVVAHANVLLGEARAAHVHVTGESPPAPTDWRECALAPMGPPLAPVFTQHYEFRLVGDAPFTNRQTAVTEGFIRERDAPERFDAPRLTALLDTWWPALFTTLDRPRSMATTSFTAEFLLDPSAIPGDALLRYRARTVASGDGYCVEFRELWHGDVVVAMNQQTFAILV